MYRLRQVSPFVVVLLALLLHCAQACLAAGHTHAAITVPASTHHGPAHAPCHSSPTSPQGTPDKCPGCGDQVFLTVPAGAEALAAAGPSLSPLCRLTQPFLPSLLHPPASAGRLEGSALSPPRYLTLTVLRL